MLKKTYALLILFGVIIVSFAVLLLCTAKKHDRTLEAYLSDYAETDRYRNLTVTDRTGAAIYAGRFDANATVRKATFHIIGDQYGSIPASVLSKEARKEPTISTLSGYCSVPEETKLTIDLRLQVGAYTLLENGGYRGAVVVLDYTSGEIIALVSTPSVDVLDPTACEDEAFVCKATSAYTPGSVMKTVAAACALEKDRQTAEGFRYTCSGQNGHLCCFDNCAHGYEGLPDILSNSCNCGVGALVNTMILPEDLNTFAAGAHFLDGKTVLDYETADGNIDSSDDVWWSACGQSKDLATPIGMASFYASVANHGVLSAPHLFSDTKPESYDTMSAKTAAYLVSSLRSVADSAGVGCSAFAKSGTAQLGAGEPHNWFVCCLTDEDAPPYAIAVFLEHGGNASPAKSLLASFVNHYVLGGGD